MNRYRYLDIQAHKTGLLAILVTFVILGIFYDTTVPLFEKPDELKHFAVIQFIQTHHQLPIVREGVYKAWDQEGTQPPLYHLLVAVAVSGLELDDFQEPPRNPHYVDERSFVWRERDNNNLYLHEIGETWSMEPVFLAARIARWLSLLAGIGTIWGTYLLAELIFSALSSYYREFSRWFALLTAGAVAFLPQFLHVSTAITNDSLSVTLAVGTLFLLASIIKNGATKASVIGVGLTSGLGAITKLSLLYLWPLIGLVFLFDFYRHRSFYRLLSQISIVGASILLLSGWWYWRNWQLYGDISALSAHLIYRGGPLDPRPTLGQIWQTEMTGLELSFWAAFGAGQILLEPWLYTGLRSIKYLVFLGLLIGLGRNLAWSMKNKETLQSDKTEQAVSKNSLKTRWVLLTLLMVWSLVIFIALLRWMQITPASWGRLLFPTLPTLGILAVWSLSQFRIPTLSFSRRLAIGLPLIIVLALFLLSLIAPFRYLQTAYAKPDLIAEAKVPIHEIDRLNFTYDDLLRLIGYRVGKSSIRPGEWLPVTLYWQAIRPIDKNYSLFIHLLGQDKQVVGQTNTYPAGGRWPTSLLEPHQVLEYTYYVQVSSEARTPDVLRLAIGVFEFEDPVRAAKTAMDTNQEMVEPIVGAVPLLPHQWPELQPTYSLKVNFADQIKLVGYDWGSNMNLGTQVPIMTPEAQLATPVLSSTKKMGTQVPTIKAGTRVPITFYWEPLNSPEKDLNLFIHLIDPKNGEQVDGFDGPPTFPTSFWKPGYKIVDMRSLNFSDDLSSGEYSLVIGWYDLDTFTRLPVISSSDNFFPLLTVSVEDEAPEGN